MYVWFVSARLALLFAKQLLRLETHVQSLGQDIIEREALVLLFRFGILEVLDALEPLVALLDFLDGLA